MSKGTSGERSRHAGRAILRGSDHHGHGPRRRHGVRVSRPRRAVESVRDPGVFSSANQLRPSSEVRIRAQRRTGERHRPRPRAHVHRHDADRRCRPADPPGRGAGDRAPLVPRATSLRRARGPGSPQRARAASGTTIGLRRTVCRCSSTRCSTPSISPRAARCTASIGELARALGPEPSAPGISSNRAGSSRLFEPAPGRP